MLVVAAQAPDCRSAGADAVHPALAERVVEDGGIVAAAAGGGAFAPVDAVRRGIDVAAHPLVGGAGAAQLAVAEPGAAPAVVGEHLEAFRGARGLLIEPYPDAVPLIAGPQRQHPVGTRLHVQLRALPMHAVAAGGQRHPVEPAGVVPQLEQPVRRIVEGAVLEWTGSGTQPEVHLQRRLRHQHRACLVQHRGMELAPQGTLGDQKLVHQELPPHVDRDHRRRPLQVGDRPRLPRLGRQPARRPLRRLLDSVVAHRARFSCAFAVAHIRFASSSVTSVPSNTNGLRRCILATT